MMFSKKSGEPFHDLADLRGDPWLGGNIHDRPEQSAVNDDLAQYDAWVDAKLGEAGIHPSHPDIDALRRTIADSDMMGGSPQNMEHGHVLPMTRRDFLEHSPQSTRDVIAQQNARGDALLAEYQQRYPDMIAVDGLHEAVAGAVEYFQERGQKPSDDFAGFLGTVASFHRAGVGPMRGEDTGRTSGIGSSGGFAPELHPNDSDQAGMVSDLRSLQRSRGIY